MTNLLDSQKIEIVSGEGELGTVSEYKGTRTMRALKMFLKKERCNGDRFAYARVLSHTNNYGDVYIDVETGEYI